jgi:FtsP/CotA-like multicopper oxidase with cupredoxin domain
MRNLKSLHVAVLDARRLLAVFACIAAGAFLASACAKLANNTPGTPGPTDTGIRARFETPLAQLNDGPCRPGQVYTQEDLREPTRIGPHQGRIQTELVVALRKRCVPVWVSTSSTTGSWQMQTLSLRSYGFPKNPDRPITESDANNPDSSNIAWSAPGPTFVMQTASAPGAPDGTRFKMRLYNRMPFLPNDTTCVVNLKCNTSGPDAGVNPATGQCKVTPTREFGGFPPQTPGQTVAGQVVEPPNCFHGLNSTNFHFHGFHVSPHLPQDNVNLEIRPPLPPGAAAEKAHGAHGPDAPVAYGHFDFDVDPLRYSQAPGTHWYHAHKHGATALQVLNGQVGTVEVQGEFDRKLDDYFRRKGGGRLVNRLLVVQQIQELPPGLGGADQNGAILVNGQGNPKVHMKRGEIQRWRFVGATMQGSAALRIGFPDIAGKPRPEVRQIAMDGVQFSPDNYACQPFLNQPDCTPAPNDSSFDELTAFNLNPGNRVDVLVKAPTEAGAHCVVLDITTKLAEVSRAREAHAARAQSTTGTCGVSNGLGPLFTLVVDGGEQEVVRNMTFPSKAEFPAMPPFLADIPPVTDKALQKTVAYQMVGQGNLAGGPGSGTGQGNNPGSQFWINQKKYDPGCANETVTVDVPEQWTLRNNSLGVAHPFHIHQNPFQLHSQSDRGTYKYPVWRDVLAIPTATTTASPAPTALEPNSNPDDPNAPWGKAVMTYVAKEFTGAFVNHCHILGHEDRGMMHNTQSVCANGGGATTGPVAPGARCSPDGFCPSDCATGKPVSAVPMCAAPPPQQSDWPKAFGYPPAQMPQGNGSGGKQKF